MAVVDRTGQPLPDGHPFKGTQIHFGLRPPQTSQKNSAPPPDSPATFPATRQPWDLQNLPEDPVIRPMLISNGVPRHLWPEGTITGEQADELIRKYGV